MMDVDEEDFRRMEGLPGEVRFVPSRGSSLIGWIAVALVMVAIVLLIAFWPGVAHAEEYTDEQIVASIYKAEGGAKAQYLYGIRSVRYLDAAEARRICFNTVRNNRKRWAKAGNPGEYLEFLARKYCPVGAGNDPYGLNKNWLKNVRYHLAKGSH